MKKHLVLGAVLAVTATPALATKARLLSLGEDFTGSQYINDNRNIFLNAASVNLHKNQVILELGGDGAETSVGDLATARTVAKTDGNTTPQAEGGVLMSTGNLVYGVYFGGESAYTQDARRYLNLKDRRVHQDNQLDLFVGGEAGVKWGANLTYSNGNDDNGDIKSNSMAARLGVIADNVEGFANVSLANKFEGNLGAGAEKEEFDGKLGYELGGTYNLGFAKVFAYWRHAGWEQSSDEATLAGPLPGAGVFNGDADVVTDKYTIGYGREEKLNDKATLFMKLAYVMNKRELDAKGTGKATLDDYSIPLTVGLEYDATSWLTLRGSVVQSIVNEQDNDYDAALLAGTTVNPLITGAFRNGKRTLQNQTSLRSGATLKFGDFSVDGLLMTDAAGTNAGNSNGTLNTENLLMRVAATYKF